MSNAAWCALSCRTNHGSNSRRQNKKKYQSRTSKVGHDWKGFRRVSPLVCVLASRETRLDGSALDASFRSSTLTEARRSTRSLRPAIVHEWGAHGSSKVGPSSELRLATTKKHSDESEDATRRELRQLYLVSYAQFDVQQFLKLELTTLDQQYMSNYSKTTRAETPDNSQSHVHRRNHSVPKAQKLHSQYAF